MIDLRIIRGRDFIRTDVDDTLDVAASRQLLRQLAQQNVHSTYDILLDVRDTDIQLTLPEVFELVEALKQHAPLFRKKLAILDDWDATFDRTQFFEVSAQLQGFQVRAFIHFEAAVAWIWDDER